MMNPILASEGRRRMRSWRTPVILTTLCALLLLFSYLQQLHMFMGASISMTDMQQGVFGYATMLVMQFALIVMVAPLMSAGSIAGERERQTLDLLLVTNTGSFAIVMGKLLENFVFLALLIVGMLPISCVGLLYGSISLQNIAMSTLFLLVCAFAALSVGVLCSVLFRRTVTAAIIAYSILLAIGLCTLLPVAFWLRNDALMKQIAQGGIGLRQAILSIPQSVWFNPGVGLVAIIDSQTHLLMGALENFGFDKIFIAFGSDSTTLVAWLNMAASLALALLLTFIAAACLRARSMPRAHRKKQESKS